MGLKMLSKYCAGGSALVDRSGRFVISSTGPLIITLDRVCAWGAWDALDKSGPRAAEESSSTFGVSASLSGRESLAVFGAFAAAVGAAGSVGRGSSGASGFGACSCSGARRFKVAGSTIRVVGFEGAVDDSIGLGPSAGSGLMFGLGGEGGLLDASSTVWGFVFAV